MDGCSNRWKEGNVLFNDALNTFCLLLYGVGSCMDEWMDGCSNGWKEGKLYLMTHSTHFFYCYMASTITYRTIVRGNSQSPHGLLFSIISSGNITLLNEKDVIAFFVCTL